MTDYVGRLIDNKLRVVSPNPWSLQVFMQERDDARNLPCKCCATECDFQIYIVVVFCGMVAVRLLSVPGILDGTQIETLPDDSYLIVSGQVSCGPCGWFLDISVCGYCTETEQAASDAFTAFIPFSATPKADGTYCPSTDAAIDLICFSEQFGIPCVTSVSAEFA